MKDCVSCQSKVFQHNHHFTCGCGQVNRRQMGLINRTACWPASDRSKSETKCAINSRSDSSKTQSFDLPVQMNNGQWIMLRT